MSEWQDISTAPLDGTKIDLWCIDVKTGSGYRFPESHFDSDRRQWHGMAELIWPDVDLPTHWMHIPKAPL